MLVVVFNKSSPPRSFQMKRSLVILTVLCLILGCATYHPPKIEGNRYQNYRHGFALELPGEPWVVPDKLPARFESSMGAAVYPARKRKLLLSNNQTNALITVQCSRSTHDFDYLFRKALYRVITRELEKTKKASLKSEAVTRFDYNVSFQGVSGQTFAWTYEMDLETPIQRIRLITRGRAYPIGGDTHIVEIGLWSDQFTFNENLEVFDKLYKSFVWDESLAKPTAE